MPRDPYETLDAFLTEHRRCRPGLDDDVSPSLVLLWCSCGARFSARLQSPSDEKEAVAWHAGCVADRASPGRRLD